MISGLVSRQTKALVNKVPMLGDLPIIGAFFRSVDYKQEDTELVIVVTPRLVRPIARGVSAAAGAKQEASDTAFNAWGYYLMGPMSGQQMPGFHGERHEDTCQGMGGPAEREPLLVLFKGDGVAAQLGQAIGDLGMLTQEAPAVEDLAKRLAEIAPQVVFLDFTLSEDEPGKLFRSAELARCWRASRQAFPGSRWVCSASPKAPSPPCAPASAISSIPRSRRRK